MTAPPEKGDRVAVAKMIRLAFFNGIALFGAVIYFIHNYSDNPPSADMSMLRIPIMVIMAGSVGGILFARSRLNRATTAAEASTMSLIGWAFGELPALLGGMYYLMTNDPRFYAVGFFLLLASFILVPIRTDLMRQPQ